MYYDSARLIRGFEEIMNNREDKYVQSEYQMLFDNNAIEIKNRDFVQRISYAIEKEMEGKKKKLSNNSNSFKTFLRYLLKAIAKYQEKVIEANFIEIEDISRVRFDRNQAFLSYAYSDKGLIQALFYYFLVAIRIFIY